MSFRKGLSVRRAVTGRERVGVRDGRPAPVGVRDGDALVDRVVRGVHRERPHVPDPDGRVWLAGVGGGVHVHTAARVDGRCGLPHQTARETSSLVGAILLTPSDSAVLHGRGGREGVRRIAIELEWGGVGRGVSGDHVYRGVHPR